MNQSKSNLVSSAEQILGYHFREPSLIEHALIHGSYSNGTISYKRLAFIGDAALYLAMANYLNVTYPKLKRGYISRLRSANLSNEKLARVAVRHNIYSLVQINSPKLDKKVKKFTKAVKQESEDEIYGGSTIKAPKVLADVVEAIAAAIYQDCNFNLDMMWEVVKRLLEPLITADTFDEQPVTALIQFCKKKSKVGTFVSSAERILGYHFRKPSLLVHALTHGSYSKGTISYKRLEFIGNAALYLAMANYLNVTYPKLKRGYISRLRSANLSNEKLARVAVRHNIYSLVQINSPKLDKKVKNFTEAVKQESENEIYGGSTVKAPKVLAHVVKAIAAAIYQDCNFNLDMMWEVVKRLLEPVVTADTFDEQPVTAVIQFWKKKGKVATFDYTRKGKRTICEVHVDGVKVGYGSANNKYIAKLNAARDALEKLKEVELDELKQELLVLTEALHKEVELAEEIKQKVELDEFKQKLLLHILIKVNKEVELDEEVKHKLLLLKDLLTAELQCQIYSPLSSDAKSTHRFAPTKMDKDSTLRAPTILHSQHRLAAPGPLPSLSFSSPHEKIETKEKKECHSVELRPTRDERDKIEEVRKEPVAKQKVNELCMKRHCPPLEYQSETKGMSTEREKGKGKGHVADPPQHQHPKPALSPVLITSARPAPVTLRAQTILHSQHRLATPGPLPSVSFSSPHEKIETKEKKEYHSVELRPTRDERDKIEEVRKEPATKQKVNELCMKRHCPRPEYQSETKGMSTEREKGKGKGHVVDPPQHQHPKPALSPVLITSAQPAPVTLRAQTILHSQHRLAAPGPLPSVSFSSPHEKIETKEKKEYHSVELRPTRDERDKIEEVRKEPATKQKVNELCMKRHCPRPEYHETKGMSAEGEKGKGEGHVAGPPQHQHPKPALSPVTASGQPAPGYNVTVEGRERRERRLPCCAIDIGWLLFILGFFLGGIPWYIGAIMLYYSRVDYREKPGYIGCTIALVLATIASCLYHIGAIKGPADW